MTLEESTSANVGYAKGDAVNQLQKIWANAFQNNDSYRNEMKWKKKKCLEQMLKYLYFCGWEQRKLERAKWKKGEWNRVVCKR